MKRIACVVAVTAFTFAASAASAQSAPPIWSGLYVGGHVGGGWGRLTGLEDGGEVKPRGVVGGVHAGYAWQSGTLVYGVEGDYSASQMKWSLSDGENSAAVRTSYIATLRARAGMASGSALFYLTGGIAFANLKATLSDGVDTLSLSDSGSGWVVGAGVEYKMTSNWSARLEGLHHRFNVGFEDTSGRYTINQLRLGVSHKF